MMLPMVDTQLRSPARVLEKALKDEESVRIRRRSLSQKEIDAMTAGRKAAKARRDAMTPTERAKEVMDARFEKIMNEFLDACLGKGKFKDLDRKTQAALLVKAMEWSIGRPNTGKPVVEEKPEKESIGITFE